EFQRTAGRLITISSAKESSGAGLGHSEENYTTITVTLLSE
ncbi:MAG: hypothetical protein QOG27_1197, partial [Verrucomicrobiota bacterium]